MGCVAVKFNTTNSERSLTPVVFADSSGSSANTEVNAVCRGGDKGLDRSSCCELLRVYPLVAFLAAMHEAARYGLYDLDRLDTIHHNK